MADAEQPKVQEPPQQIVPFVRSSDFRTVYANHMRMRVNPTEVSLTFGFIDEVMPGVQVAQESFGVVLTPRTARSLANILSKTMDVFERQYGKIQEVSQEPLNMDEIFEIIRSELHPNK